MKWKIRLLNVLQILVGIAMFITFFLMMPRFDTRPISDIDRYVDSTKGNPPPNWAMSFMDYRGVIHYYPSSAESRIREGGYLLILLIGELIFLFWSSIYAFRIHNNVSWDIAIVESLSETLKNPKITK
jgi:hypothetical protein